MSIYLELVNYDKLFRSMTINPTILNDVRSQTTEDKDALKDLLYTRYLLYSHYGGDVMSVVPACNCGEVQGMDRLGVICGNCKSEVAKHRDRKLEPIVWLRAPKGVKKLMNVHMWGILSNCFTLASFETLRWICDPTYLSRGKVPENLVNEIEAIGIKRGWNNFCENFDSIIDKLFSLPQFENRPVRDDIVRMIGRYRDCIFSDYLPVINRSWLVVEVTNVGRFTDPNIGIIMDAIGKLVSIDLEQNDRLSVSKREVRVVKTIVGLSQYFNETFKNTIAKKAGMLRKDIFSCRNHFSFRAVISSITDKHSYHELHVPWFVGVGSLYLHLLNKLTRRGFSSTEALTHINEHSGVYSPLLDELFKELIDESPEKGIPVIFCRFPSLERGNTQLLWVTKVKSDVNDPTASMSILDMANCNGDFDGDALSGQFLLDNHLTALMDPLSPDKNCFNLNRYITLSNNLVMPAPVVSTTSSWLQQPVESTNNPAMDEFLIS